MEAISRIEAFSQIHGPTTVMWRVNAQFAAANPGPYTFTVHVSKSGADDDWFVVGQTSQPLLQDINQRAFGKGPWPFYRVRVQAGNGVQKDSRKIQAYGGFDVHDRPIVAEILRKEREILASRAGRCGWLFKRKHWGEPCTENIDQDTGDLVPRGDKASDTCFGTGFAGGYHAPLRVPMVPSARAEKQSRRLGIDLTKGHSDLEGSTSYWRTVACPWVETDDVWVDALTDKRYFVGRVFDVDFRGVPIIHDPVELRLAATDDVIYYLPRPEE